MRSFLFMNRIGNNAITMQFPGEITSLVVGYRLSIATVIKEIYKF